MSATVIGVSGGACSVQLGSTGHVELPDHNEIKMEQHDDFRSCSQESRFKRSVAPRGHHAGQCRTRRPPATSATPQGGFYVGPVTSPFTRHFAFFFPTLLRIFLNDIFLHELVIQTDSAVILGPFSP